MLGREGLGFGCGMKRRGRIEMGEERDCFKLRFAAFSKKVSKPELKRL